MLLRSTSSIAADGALAFAAAAPARTVSYSKHVHCATQYVVAGRVKGTFHLTVNAAGAVNTGYGYPSAITVYAVSNTRSGKVTVSSTGSISSWNGFCEHV